MCAEHAAHERVSYEAQGKLERLNAALFGSPARLHGWVAVDEAEPIGYATATVEFATWSAEPFMHMDCLFVRARHRNRKVGLELISAVVREAERRRIRDLQWQTPQWNADADRFYRRIGARVSEKYRYTLSLAEAK
jgi:GNAT superfamily N-acetyltransferase